jgi:hypothetical protein
MLSSGKKLAFLLIIMLTLVLLPSSIVFADSSEQSWNSLITSPTIEFSMNNGSTVCNLGNFSIGLNVQGCQSYDMLIMPAIYSVYYVASWQNAYIQVYNWTDGSPNSINSFFYSIDLTQAPLGNQQIAVTVVAGGKSFAGGPSLENFSKTSSSVIDFTVIAPPEKQSIPNHTIDTSGTDGNCPLVLDSRGYPHIAYTAVDVGYEDNSHVHWYGYDLVKYASWTGYNWSIQIIAMGSVQGLFLDAKGNSHISYEGDGGLMYASWIGTTWVTQTLNQNGGGVVALDSAGNPSVAFIDGKSLIYASWNDSAWNKQTVVSDSQISGPIYLELDAYNDPFILYDSPVNVIDNGTIVNASYVGGVWQLDFLKMATRNNGTWDISNVSYAVGFSNMVLDPKGYPHLLYQFTNPEFTGRDNVSLVYASWNGKSWDNQVVVSNCSIDSMNLVLDPQGYPQITYTTPDPLIHANSIYLSSDSLMYASWTGKNWEIQTIDSPASGLSFLAFDFNGNPHISYIGQIYTPNGYIHYAQIMYTTASEPLHTSTSSQSTQRSPALRDIVFPLLAILIAFLIIVGAILVFASKKRRRNTS